MNVFKYSSDRLTTSRICSRCCLRTFNLLLIVVCACFIIIIFLSGRRITGEFSVLIHIAKCMDFVVNVWGGENGMKYAVDQASQIVSFSFPPLFLYRTLKEFLFIYLIWLTRIYHFCVGCNFLFCYFMMAVFFIHSVFNA